LSITLNGSVVAATEGYHILRGDAIF